MSNNKQSSIEFYRLENQKLVAISMLGGMTVEEYFSSEEILYNKAKAMHKEEMINFHIEVMKSGLIKEGEVIWTDAYLPKISSIANQKYNKKFGGNNEQ